jgi:putative tricarboxylic transport membrane protein
MAEIKKDNRIVGFFFLAIGIFFALYSRTVEIGTLIEPGPGFLPFFGGLTLAVMSIALLLKTSLKKMDELRPAFFPQRDSWKRVLLVFLSLIAYNLILKPLGFTLTTFLFIGFLYKFIFPQSLKKTLVVAFLSALGARLLFINFLETQLPKGFLGF